MTVKNLARKLVEKKVLVPVLDDIYIHREELKYYEKRVIHFLEQFHKEFPLKEGMGIEEARNKLALGKNEKLSDAIFEILKENKVVKEQKGLISKYRFQVMIQEDESSMIL